LGQVDKGSQFLAIGVQVLVEWVDAANRLAGEQSSGRSATSRRVGENPRIAGRIMLLDMLCAMMAATVPSATVFLT